MLSQDVSPSMCPSVCPSVTRRYFDETVIHYAYRQTFFTLVSHTILVFAIPNGIAVFRRLTFGVRMSKVKITQCKS